MYPLEKFLNDDELKKNFNLEIKSITKRKKFCYQEVVIKCHFVENEPEREENHYAYDHEQLLKENEALKNNTINSRH
eukprot:UN12318